MQMKTRTGLGSDIKTDRPTKPSVDVDYYTRTVIDKRLYFIPAIII